MCQAPRAIFYELSAMGGGTYGDWTDWPPVEYVNLSHAITTDRAELAGHGSRRAHAATSGAEAPREMEDEVAMVAPAARIGQIGKLLYIHRF